MLGTIGVLIAAPIVGAVLHELTHAAVATALGAERVDVDLRHLAVEYEMRVCEPLWKDRLVNLAPQILGVGAASVYVLVGSRPSGVLGLAAVLAWGVYTLLGGFEDYSLAAARGEETAASRLRSVWWEMDSRARDAALALTLGVAGVFAWTLGYNVQGRLGVTLVRMADGTFIAAMLLASATVVRFERSAAAR